MMRVPNHADPKEDPMMNLTQTTALDNKLRDKGFLLTIAETDDFDLAEALWTAATAALENEADATPTDVAIADRVADAYAVTYGLRTATPSDLRRQLLDRAIARADAHPEWQTSSIEISARADGSNRLQATLRLIGPEGDEVTDVIIAPAPANAPRWATRTWTIAISENDYREQPLI